MEGNGCCFIQLCNDILFKTEKESENFVLMAVITCRTSASKETWETLEGTFSLSTMPQRVIFYLEGPSPGVDLLIKSVVITCMSPKKSEVISIFLFPTKGL